MKKNKLKDTGNSCKIHTFPRELIERQRWVNFISRANLDYEGLGKWHLLCWYIGAETGRLVGVYTNDDMDKTFFLSFWIKDDGFDLYSASYFKDDKDMLDNIRMSSIIETTPLMPCFIGATKFRPEKQECKILAFPGVDIPTDILTEPQSTE